MNIWRSILQALYMAFAMFWEILWPLILGFAMCLPKTPNAGKTLEFYEAAP
jgi:hypothetical protein